MTTQSLPSFTIFLRVGCCSWQSSFTVQKATLDFRPGSGAKPSVLHWHAVKAWRRVRFPELAAALGILLTPFRKQREAFRQGSGAKLSVLHWHAVNAWRRVRFPELAAALGISSTVQKATLGLQTRQLREAVRHWHAV